MMKNILLSPWNHVVTIGVAAFLLAACGDDVTQINQTGIEAVDAEDDLPKCTKDNENELVFVKEDLTARICTDGEWVAMKGESSCTTKELKDKSGYKIVCDGDSIGVVLNGSDGKDGKDAELPQDTLEADSERVAISLDSLVGVTQKGPFLKGSTVYLYELSDGHTLKQTNGNFTSNITSEDGRYKFTARDLVSQYAMVVVDGYYRNEVTGNTSDAPIRLKAITDMRKRSSVNVNILTQLEFDRVYSLVTRGNSKGEKLTVKQAKKQAQKEILELFDIELDYDTDAEDMNVFGKTDADAALLALSVLLQGDRTESDMMALLAEISNALADNGSWNDSLTKAQIALWAAVADGQGRLDSISNYVKGWGLGGGNVPPFEQFIRNFFIKETGLGVCGGKVNALGTTKVFKTDSDSLVFVCDDAKKGWWRLLTNLDKDTLGWGLDFEEGDVRNGQLNTNLTYVYENGNWRHGTSLDSILGMSCIMARKDTLLRVSAVDYYMCVGDTAVSFEESHWTSAWRQATNVDLDRIYWEENKNEDGLLLKGPYTGRTMVWDNGRLREAILVEQQLEKACVKEMYGETFTLWNSLAYTCSDTGWSRTGTFKDARDGRIYKGVMIGNLTWMAENLKYEFGYYNGEYTEGTYYDTYCTDGGKDTTYCAKWGRIYKWSAAMDSAGLVKSNYANNCGKGTTCSPRTPVRGVCPVGWHLPSSDEWSSLIKEAGGALVAGRVLKADGIDSLSFSVEDGTYMENKAGFCLMVNEAFGYWTSSEAGNSSTGILAFTSDDNVSMFSTEKDCGFYVRCVKD